MTRCGESVRARRRGQAARRAIRRRSRARSLLFALLALLELAAPAEARGLELFGGRLQFHGFYEMQMRSLGKDFDPSNAWDLSQWYHVGMLEIEGDLVEDPTWIVDEAGFSLRLEVRYDCVWCRACGLFRSADACGHRAEHLPERLQNGRRSGCTGTRFTGDRRPKRLLGRDDADFASKDLLLEHRLRRDLHSPGRGAAHAARADMQLAQRRAGLQRAYWNGEGQDVGGRAVLALVHGRPVLG